MFHVIFFYLSKSHLWFTAAFHAYYYHSDSSSRNRRCANAVNNLQFEVGNGVLLRPTTLSALLSLLFQPSVHQFCIASRRFLPASCSFHAQQ